MDRANIQAKHAIHKQCRSHIDKNILSSLQGEIINDFEFPSFAKQKKINRFLKPVENREVLTTEPSEEFDQIKAKNLENEEVSSNDKHEKINRSLDLLKDQDKIIKLQNDLIYNLRNEIFLLENNQNFETETFEENTEKNKSEEAEKIEELEVEIKRLNKTLKKKDELISEMKVEIEICVQKKDLKISKLESVIGKMRLSKSIDSSELDELKNKYEEEMSKRKIIESDLMKSREQCGVLNEENKYLLQKFEDVKRRAIEYEKFYNDVKNVVNKISNSKDDIQSIPYFIESLSLQNNNISEKVNLLNEKIILIEKEKDLLKNQLLKSQRKMKGLKFKEDFSEKNEILIEKLQKKNREILELRKNLSLKDRLKTDSSSDTKLHPVIKSHISVIEEELNYLKTENKILSNKEDELSEKLKNSEKSRCYYQEETINLKEKVNHLENQLKLIESSLLELKSQNRSFQIKRF